MRILLLALSMTLTAVCSVAAVPVDFSKIDHWTGSGSNQAALVIMNDAGAGDPTSYVWGYRWENGSKPTGQDMFRAICANSTELVLLTQLTGVYGSTVCGIGFGDAGKLLEYIYFDFEKAKNYEFINFDYYNSSSLFGQKEAPGDKTPEICQAAIDEARSSNSHIIDHPLNYTAYGYPAYDYDCWLAKDGSLDYGWWSSAWYEGYWSYWTAHRGGDDWEYSGSGFSGRILSDGAIDAWTFTKFPSAMIGGVGEGTPPSEDVSLYSYRPSSTQQGTTVVDEIDEANNSKAVYYTLSGVRVAETETGLVPELPHGLYIKVSGGKSSKVAIR